MLFNSYEFLFGYLPLVVIVFYGIAVTSHVAAAAWLAVASLFFYGWWNPGYVALLLGSVLFNFSAGLVINRSAGRMRLTVMWVALAADLLLLGYYKYANFFLSGAHALAGAPATTPLLEIVLPLGISFFTFTQIAYLVDVYRGIAKEASFIHYLLFVTYFPHLIAGPVLHHKEIMPQFAQAQNYTPKIENYVVGLTIFAFGLFKKVVLADSIAPYGSTVFAAAKAGESLSFFPAWGGALAYTFQLYFDFSGYSDMAIGLSRLFGVKLPLNFDSPYKAANIVEFWRRWHMTLSRFLRDYLYIALGGNRHGAVRRYINLFLTMLLGGLWHGAGWTFVVWGGLHGLYLVVNHAWRWVKGRTGMNKFDDSRVAQLAGWALTFFVVVVGWVFFRADSFEAAKTMLAGMFGFNGMALPAAIIEPVPLFKDWATKFGITAYLGGGGQFVLTWLWIVALSAIAFLVPNTQEIMRHYEPALDYLVRESNRLAWRPSGRWLAVMSIIAALGLISLNRVSEFLYFQF